MQRAGRWAGLSNPFAKVLAARPGSGKRSSGAESSASSGGGAGAELGKAFLGSCLKESKRDCRSVQLSAFYTIVTSRLHSLPFGKLQITTNLAPKRRKKKKKKKKREREREREQISFSLLTLPFLSPSLPLQLARPPSFPLRQPLVSRTRSLSDGTQQLLGYFSAPFLFSPPFAMNWTYRRWGGCAFCPREWRFASWGRAGEDRPRRKKE